MAVVVTYRRTHSLSMRIVKNGDVHVSAPIGISKRLVEAFIAQHKDWMDKAREKSFQRQKRQAAFFSQLPLDTAAQKADAAQRIASLIMPMVAHHSQIMGVSPSAVKFRPMTSRWGVCHIKQRSLCFSTYLLLLPQWCAEHVVVHELCHLLEPAHNARFYALMDQFYPRWKDARRVTRHCL